MDSTTLNVKKPSTPNLNEESLPMTSLYKALQELPDPRRDQGKRYDLAVILCLLVLAKLVGQTTLDLTRFWRVEEKKCIVESKYPSLYGDEVSPQLVIRGDTSIRKRVFVFGINFSFSILQKRVKSIRWIRHGTRLLLS
jgi:hypothetical protein